MPIIAEPIPEPADLPVLKPLFAHADDETFVALLLESLAKANECAQNGALDGALYDALPLPGMDGWPLTLADYAYYLTVYSRWLPQQSTDAAWTNPSAPSAFPHEHREVYDRLCWFHWLINQPLDGLNGGVLQDIAWFADFLVDWANDWGTFLDTPESFNETILDTWRKEAPRYQIEDSMIGEPLRPNAPSGWLTFNQFFARELNPGLRPIQNLGDNTTVTAPADCTYKRHFQIAEDGTIPEIVIKGTHTYASVQQLLHGSQYADAFNGGHFIHCFLGPYSYHRFHTPVAGVVQECYPLTGQVFLDVSLEDGQFEAADSATNGYEFLQARGVLTIDTTGAEAGDIGIVGVLPIGMCQVSGVNMTHAVGAPCDKGDEFGYFTFGGSDIIILLQEGTNPTWNPNFTPGTDHYSLYGTEVATVAAQS